MEFQNYRNLNNKIKYPQKNISKTYKKKNKNRKRDLTRFMLKLNIGTLKMKIKIFTQVFEIANFYKDKNILNKYNKISFIILNKYKPQKDLIL